MKDIYQEILKRVHLISFETIWTQFKPYEFALYDHERVYFEGHNIPVSEAFIGNTTISYEGRQMAIWNVSESDLTDLDRLTSNLIHEMFHAHQAVCGETRYFSDLIGLSYPLSAKNIAMKHHEFGYLIQAHLTKDLHDKRKFFSKFIEHRDIRYAELGDICNYEKAIETIEGVAEYIGLSVLRTLNQASYTKRLTEVVKRLSEINETCLDTRRVCYDSGALICLVAEALNLSFKEALVPNLKYVYDSIKADFIDDFVSESVQEQTVFEPVSETFAAIETAVENHQNKIKALVEAVVLEPKAEVVQGDFKYCGYDPMNIKRYGNYVYHTYFLGVLHDEGPKFLMGTYVTESETDDLTRFVRYYKGV